MTTTWWRRIPPTRLHLCSPCWRRRRTSVSTSCSRAASVERRVPCTSRSCRHSAICPRRASCYPATLMRGRCWDGRSRSPAQLAGPGLSAVMGCAPFSSRGRHRPCEWDPCLPALPAGCRRGAARISPSGRGEPGPCRGGRDASMQRPGERRRSRLPLPGARLSGVRGGAYGV